MTMRNHIRPPLLVGRPNKMFQPISGWCAGSKRTGDRPMTELPGSLAQAASCE